MTTIELGHGSGGQAAARFVDKVFLRRLGPQAAHRHDVGQVGDTGLVTTTDAFVVTPRVFPGGDIGSLAVHGTVNDLAAGGALPLSLTASYIVEEGLPIAELESHVDAMATACAAIGVDVVAGDTKVVPSGACDGVFITTAGVGRPAPGFACDPSSARPGDVVVVSGPVGDHGITLLAERTGLTSGLTSDSAPVDGLVRACPTAVAAGIRCLRDPTRGGIAAVINELAQTSKVAIRLREADIPVRPAVLSTCEWLGVEPWHAACEGRLVAICAPEVADDLLACWRSVPVGADSACIGAVIDHELVGVEIEGLYGGCGLLDWPAGDQFPRIC